MKKRNIQDNCMDFEEIFRILNDDKMREVSFINEFDT